MSAPASALRLLAFDTSTERMSVAACQGERQAVHEGAGGPQASATLIPQAMQLLQSLEIALSTLDAIVVGHGPGSFTGVRTACSVAQGLGHGAGVPVLGVDTLLAVAEDARLRHGATQVVVAIDARMNEVYTAQYQWDGRCWSAIGDFTVCAPEAVQVPEGWTVAGNAHAVYADRLAPHATHCDAWPTAEALLHLAPMLMDQAAPAAQLLPRYVRDKVAQTTAEREALRAAATLQTATGTQP